MPEGHINKWKDATHCILILTMTSAIIATAWLFLQFSLNADSQNHTNKYEFLDLDAILSNPRTLNSYVQCVLEKGHCSPAGRDLKENIPIALKTACTECNEAQKKFIRKASIYIMAYRPEDWTAIVEKYNPTGEYSEAFYKFLQED
ncbi:ejaculatory bulb-specific protein 3-like [Periplaneta americana]|uniref:ejaculatory bulb-specific protein 3-like n=1 Tax=Periplaneta americana TaxID=6978 RepID=UPI0037E81258